MCGRLCHKLLTSAEGGREGGRGGDAAEVFRVFFFFFTPHGTFILSLWSISLDDKKLF